MFALFLDLGKWLSYNWDIILAIGFVTIVMVLQTIFLARQGIEKRLIATTWLVYVVFCFISVACIDYMGRSERQTGSSRLLEIATTCAQAVEMDGHASLSFETPRNDPTWEHLMRLIFEWGDKNKRVASIYTIRMQSRVDESGKTVSEPVFFLCPEADFDRDGVITKPLEDEIPAGTPYTVPSERFLEETLSGKPYFAEELVVDNWGSWYTAGAPLFDESGKVVGVLCVDFWPEVWNADILSARLWPLALFGTFLIMFFVVINFIARLVVTVRSLTLANQKAEEAARAKSRFLANMSHEIRTPINAILGFIQILVGRRPVLEPDDLEMFELIGKNSKDLLTIIDDILTFSKVDSGHMVLEELPVSLRRILDDVEKTMAPMFQVKPNVEFRKEFVGEIPEMILSDPTRLRQIISNLVGNALKFTSQGSILVRCERLPDRQPDQEKNDHSAELRFSVIDTGIGISPEKIKTLFEPFVQADSSSTRKYGGTGLGLSISKRLAELLGGTMTLKSAPGQGSCFMLTLHAVLPSREQLDEVSSRRRSGRSSFPDTREFLSRENLKKKNPLFEQSRFLVVDDGKVNQLVLSTSLKDLGAKVETAENGHAALDLIHASEEESRPFDLIFMDVQMPVMDGLEATRRLRREGYARPIIAVTANAFEEDRQAALEAGCDDYLSKPVNIPEMFHLIKRLLGHEE